MTRKNPTWQPLTPDDPRHGTNAGHRAHFSKGGDRTPCQPCKDAHAAYRRGLWRRKYLRGLSTLYVDATGAHRRIQALCALGWRHDDINRAAGWATNHAGGRSHQVLTHKRIHVDTYLAVIKAYDALSMRTPNHRYVARQRKLARDKGWVPPLAWNDDEIDDPAAKPHGVNVAGDRRGGTRYDPVAVERVLAGDDLPLSKRERWEVIRRWPGSDFALQKRFPSWNVARDRSEMRALEAAEQEAS